MNIDVPAVLVLPHTTTSEHAGTDKVCQPCQMGNPQNPSMAHPRLKQHNIKHQARPSHCACRNISNNNFLSQTPFPFSKVNHRIAPQFEIIEPEAQVVDSESIHSGNVLGTVNPPRPATPSAGDLHLATTVYSIARGRTAVVKRPRLHIYTRE